MTYYRWTRFAATLLAACAALLSGCTTYVTSEVIAFSNWSGSDATRTYAFTRSPAQQNSIQQATYEQLVSNELAMQAFRLVDEPHARYLVALAYGSRTDQVLVPQPVPFNPWPGPYWGGFNPWGPWGPFPPAFVNQTVPLYSHVLGIRITERESGREVYNVTARNAGDEPSLVRAMPYLVRSALADFPLSNGAVRTVKLPVDRHGGAASNEVPVAPDGASAPAAAKSPQ
jgi:hypothetical protein